MTSRGVDPRVHAKGYGPVRELAKDEIMDNEPTLPVSVRRLPMGLGMLIHQRRG